MKKRLTFKISFKWFDLWVGAYWDKAMEALYVCLLPMLPIRIGVEYVRVCETCEVEMKKVAVCDEGWTTIWECPSCGDTDEYPWPYGDNMIGSKQLEDAGFEIV